MHSCGLFKLTDADLVTGILKQDQGGVSTPWPGFWETSRPFQRQSQEDGQKSSQESCREGNRKSFPETVQVSCLKEEAVSVISPGGED